MYHSENAMRFAGGSTILDNKSRSGQTKAKGPASFYGRLKKVIGAIGHVFPYPLYKRMVALTRQLPRANLDGMNSKWARMGESYCIIFVD